MIEQRLDLLCELASDLPDEYATLRTALGDLVFSWNVLPCPLEAQGMLQAMLDHSHAQLAYLDSQFNFLAVNAAYTQGSGYTRDELIGRNHFDVFPHAENQAIFAQARDSGETVTFTARPFVFPNRPDLGTTYWDWILVPIKDAKGAVCGLVLSLTDVTPREVARQALAESEQRYRLLMDTMAEGLASLDLNGSITFVNDEFCRMLGYSRDELIGRHHLKVVHPQQHQRHKDALAARTNGQPGSFETMLTCRDGSSLPVIQAGRPLRDREGNVCGTLAAFTDISDRRAAELALSAERDFVSAVLDTANALVVVLDTQGRIMRFNRACEKLTGYAFHEVRGELFWDLFLTPEEMEETKATFEYLRAGHFPNQRENYWVARDGTRRLIAWSNTAILDAEGAVQHIVSTGIDVTEARLAEEAVQSVARFPSENPQPVLRVSREGVILYANEASRGLLAMWATQVGRLLPDEWCDLAMDVLRNSGPCTIEMLCGEIVYSVDIVPVAGGSYVNLYASDITPQAKAQAALQVAHDELEERVQERTRELEAANQSLEALSQSDRRQRLAAEGLLETTLILNSSLNLDQVLDRILAQTQRTVLCAAVAVIPMAEEPTHIARQHGLAKSFQNGEILSAFLFKETLHDVDAANEHRSAVVITDTLGERNVLLPAGLEWVRSYVAIPLQVEQAMIGTLCAFSDQPDFFGQETLHLLEGFAAHAATAIHNAELYEAAVHAQSTAESLAAASVGFTQTLDLESVMNTLLDYLHRLIPYDGATVALRWDSSRLVVRAARGKACPMGEAAIIDVETNPQIRALLETPRAILISDTCVHPEWKCHDGASNGISWLGVPMIANDQVIGICDLCRVEGKPFTPEQARVVEALVGQAAVAIQNAWLFGQVRAGQDRLQALSRRLVEVQEDERRYIARELHDEAAQALTSVQMGLSLLERQVEHAAPVRSRLNDLNRALDGVLENLSRLINHLRPASLDHLGLAPALRQYIKGISEQHQITVAYETLGLYERLAPDVEAAIYRIVQEALGNVVRHAHATRVDVLLERRGDKLIVLVEDNGIGLDLLAVEDSRSLGLAGMRERAEMLGGTFVVESAPGAGTTVLVEVPYGDSDTHR